MPSGERGSADTGAGDQGGIDIRLGDRPVLRLFADHGFIRVGLVMPVLDRTVDISVQPSAACRVLDDEATREQVPPTSAWATAREAIDQVAQRSGGRRPVADQDLLRNLGGACFPLLGAAYDLGGAPISEVPRWAEPVLRRSTVAAAATAAFGAKSTRPVRRALVTALSPLPSGEIDLTMLALCLMGAEALDPDRLARVLSAPRVAQPFNDLPDPATLRAVAPTLVAWGPARTERVLIDAAGRADGLRLLLVTVRYSQQLAEHGPQAPLPNRLTELHTVHRALLRGGSDGAADRHPARPVPAQRRTREEIEIAQATRRRRQEAARAQAPPRANFYAPNAPTMSLAPSHRLAVPADIRAIDGLYFGQFSFVVPATVADLVTWSEILRNCLDDFGPAVVAGRSIILGVTRRNRLTYALELNSDRQIRQFASAANRAVPEHDRLAVVTELASQGVIDPRTRVNAAWLRSEADRTA